MPLQWTAAGAVASTAMGAAGPALVPGLTDSQRHKLLQAIFEYVRTLAARMGAHRIEVAMSPLTATSLGAFHGVNGLVLHGFHDCSTHALIADLRREEKEILSDMSYDARRSAQLARKAGYTVSRTPWREAVDEYYKIHSETYQRTGVGPHPTAYFEGIAGLGDQGNAVLWVGRDASGRPVAFHNCARFGKTS